MGWNRVLSYCLMALGLVAAIVTSWVIVSPGDISGKSAKFLPLIYVDLSILLCVVLVIIRHILKLWFLRRRTGSKLHVNLIILFGGIAIIPSICVSIFAGAFLQLGVKSWFSEPVKLAINQSKGISQSYLEEHRTSIVRDIIEIEQALLPTLPHLLHNIPVLNQVLTALSFDHDLKEILLFKKTGNHFKVIARGYLSVALEFAKMPNENFKAAESSNEPVIIPNDTNTKVRGMKILDHKEQIYLYLGKDVNPQILRAVANTENAVDEYQRLESQIGGLQLTFISFFALLALLLLLGAIWVGMNIANKLVTPITLLANAAEEISHGNLEIKLPQHLVADHDIGNMAKAFSQMTTQIRQQHQALLAVNEQLEKRHVFTQTVLAGVSAGIMGLDTQRRLDLANQRAFELLNASFQVGSSLSSINKELDDLVSQCLNNQQERLYQQITLNNRILNVCIVIGKGQVILTFDDVSALISAQRKAAWSDVARKIAHEIKNPLTPIQLAAERLRRRYLKQITDGAETFSECIETIIRQVANIGRLVSEFSSFARMPEPVMQINDLSVLVEEALNLQKQAHSRITYEYNRSNESCWISCDGQQINQALTNILQNSIQALLENKIRNPKITVTIDGNQLFIGDNGPGFNEANINKLLEPYFTTRENGTGLGLAIVSRIISDHHGTLELKNNPQGGALTIISFSNLQP